MRFYHILLLVVVTLVTATHAGSTTADATFIPSHILTHSSTEKHNTHSTTRILRTATKQVDEDRAGNVPAGNVPAGNAPISTKIVNWAISPKSAEAKLTLTENIKVGKWLFKKRNSEYVFNRLQLGGGVDKVLTNPKLHVYVSYIDRFNKQHPTKKVALIDMFTNTYTDDAVARMIEIGLNTPQTKTIATRMRQELLGSWNSQGKNAEDIFSLLKMDTAKYNLFKTPQMSKDSNPTLNIFAAYIDQLNKQNPTNKVNMIDLFTKKYDDVVIAKMVEMGLQVPSMEKVSKRLRYELLAKWEDTVDDADALFKLLKLDEVGGDLFASPQFKTLYSYTKNTYVLDTKEVLLKVLSDHYGYDGLSKIFIMGQRRADMSFLAKDFENAMVAQWLRHKESPDKVFKLLKLDVDVGTLLTNPIFLRTWESYRTVFNKKNEASTTVMETLQKFYTREELTNMLVAAKEIPATKNIATKLLSDLQAHTLKDPPMKRTN